MQAGPREPPPHPMGGSHHSNRRDGVPRFENKIRRTLLRLGLLCAVLPLFLSTGVSDSQDDYGIEKDTIELLLEEAR